MALAISSSSILMRPISERFMTLRPSSTSCCTSHDAGATFVYQGHFVRLEWHSPQAVARSCSVRGLSHDGAASTGGLAWSRP
jgi:hypothetical protein